MTPRRLLILSGLALAALSSAALAQEAKVSLAGKWTGKTSQGRTIAFEIKANSIRSLDLGWIMHLEQVCPGRPALKPGLNQIKHENITYFDPSVRGYEPPKIVFPSFTYAREVNTDEMPVNVVLNGNFASDSTASGDLTLKTESCPGQEVVTWEAGRQATRVATMPRRQAVSGR